MIGPPLSFLADPRRWRLVIVVLGLMLATSTAHASDWRVLDPAASQVGGASDPATAATWSSATPATATPAFTTRGGSGVAPFVLSVASEMRDRALECLTAAIYYEAATEPREGQEAVAQVVLNRLRHPSFPKSVCGVVYEGVGTASTCQFTFACDGSTSRRPPVARLWENAREIADAALSGHVASRIGAATHYHATYVSPYWRASLTPVGQIGNHLFYRMPGWQGTPAALTGLYNNDESAPPATPARGTFLATRATHMQPAGPQSVDFTVWGLKMATISVKRGRIDVKSTAPASDGAE